MLFAPVFASRADLIVASHFGRLNGIDGHSTSQSPLQGKVRRFDPRLRIGRTAGNWSVHVIDFARCLLGDANRQIPPTLPGWRVGSEANLIESEGGPVPVLNDTARFQMRSAEPCRHRQAVPGASAAGKDTRLVSQNDS